LFEQEEEEGGKGTKEWTQIIKLSSAHHLLRLLLEQQQLASPLYDTTNAAVNKMQKRCTQRFLLFQRDGGGRGK